MPTTMQRTATATATATTRQKCYEATVRLIEAARGQYVPSMPSSSSGSSSLNPLKWRSKHYSSLLESKSAVPLRVFPLSSQHFGSFGIDTQTATTTTPSQFHTFLCDSIRNANYRISLASLYIGPGDAEKEWQLLESLRPREGVEMKCLMDASRALRPVGTTCSADALYHRGIPVYLFPVLKEPLRTLLPSPFNEVAGVFHIKAYIVDDQLILSGANLSEEYFTDRQDRYMIITNGGGGLVDFYAELIDVLCQYAQPYHPSSSTKQSSNKESLLFSNNVKERKEKLIDSLSKLLNGSNDNSPLPLRQADDSSLNNNNNDNDTDIVAYAVPTFQIPRNFFSKRKQNVTTRSNSNVSMPFLSDVQVTRNLLLTALEIDPSSSVRLSTAYLNPTPFLMSALTQFGSSRPSCNDKNKAQQQHHHHGGAAYLLTAGPTSHGFAPKKKSTTTIDDKDKIKIKTGRGRDWIPSAFLELVKEAALRIVPRGGKVLLYERNNWTFHSKGLWLTISPSKAISTTESGSAYCDPNSLVATMIGSGNYGARSERLDFESNCIFIVNHSSSSSNEDDSFRIQMANDWNHSCRHAKDYTSTTTTASMDDKRHSQTNTGTDKTTSTSTRMKVGWKAALTMMRRYF